MGSPRKSAEDLALEKEAKAEQKLAIADRKAERKRSLIEQARAMQEQAGGLTSDIRNVYMRRAKSLFEVAK